MRTTTLRIVLCLTILTACSSGSEASTTITAPTSTGPSTSDPGDFRWSFEAGDDGFVVIDDSEPDDSTSEPDGDYLGEFDSAGEDPPGEDVCPIESCEVGQPELDISEFDPCTLVTQQEWAEWREVNLDQIEVISLEHGDACGFVTDDDTIRLAFAVFSGTGWLPSTANSSPQTVAGSPASWATEYPLVESSVLVIHLADAEVVIEMSARPGVDGQILLDGAIHFGSIILGRYQP